MKLVLSGDVSLDAGCASNVASVTGRHRTIAVTSQTPVTSFSRQNLAGTPAKTGLKSLPDTYGITVDFEYARWIEMNQQVSIDDVDQTDFVQ